MLHNNEAGSSNSDRRNALFTEVLTNFPREFYSRTGNQSFLQHVTLLITVKVTLSDAVINFQADKTALKYTKPSKHYI
jgi:hypothetical protein